MDYTIPILRSREWFAANNGFLGVLKRRAQCYVSHEKWLYDNYGVKFKIKISEDEDALTFSYIIYHYEDLERLTMFKLEWG